MDRRQFLFALAASPALAWAPAEARAVLEGEAARTTPDLVRLSWTPAFRLAAIRVSSDPDASARTMRLVAAEVRNGRAQTPAPISPRPYFLLSTPGGETLRLAERLLPLQGGRNFRDLGGYRGAGGRQVRWGRIYRSGLMSGLTPADMTYLSDLGVRVICDLRSAEERRARPSPFLDRTGAEVLVHDYEMSSFAKVMRVTTRAEAIDAFAESYVDFSQALAPHYTEMFDKLVRGEAPLAVNCSAGKDRTGMASALILSVLGAPRRTILADYALTQVYAPPQAYASSGVGSVGLAQAQMDAFARMPDAVKAVMGGSDPEIMRLALARIDARHGGPIALAKSRYGLTDAKIERLRNLYLA